MIIVDIRKVQNLQPFVNRLVGSGYKWSSNNAINLEDFKGKECVYIDTFRKELTYSSYSFAKDTGARTYLCKIITLNEYMKNFSKEDLKPGMVVEYANKVKHLVVEINNEINLMGSDSFNRLSYYEDDLTIADKESDPVTATNWRIDKVYIPVSMLSLKNMLDERFLLILWERPKEIILTMQEIADKFGIQVEQLKIKK